MDRYPDTAHSDSMFLFCALLGSHLLATRSGFAWRIARLYLVAGPTSSDRTSTTSPGRCPALGCRPVCCSRSWRRLTTRLIASPSLANCPRAVPWVALGDMIRGRGSWHPTTGVRRTLRIDSNRLPTYGTGGEWYGRAMSTSYPGSFESPIKYRSTPRAALRPSAIAQTTRDCPRLASPAANTPGTLLM